MGKGARELFSPETCPTIISNDQEVLQDGKLIKRDEVLELLHSKRGRRVFEVSKAPLRDTENRIVGLLGISRDVTARRQLEADLHEKITTLQAVMDGSQDAIFVKDSEEQHTLRLTVFGRDFIGKPQLEILGKDDLELFGNEASRSMLSGDHLVLKTGQITKADEELTFKNEKRTYQVTKVPLKRSDNRIIGVIGISRDVTKERQHVADLENMDKRKNEFFAMVSHELRSPLHALLGFTENLKSELLTPTEAKCVERIAAKGNAMKRQIEGLVDFSRIKAGSLALVSTAFRLREGCDPTFDSLRNRAASKGLEFTAEVEKDTPDGLIGDKERLNQIITNLGENAIKFTPKGFVGISIAVVDRTETAVRLRIRVGDSGVGIPMDRMEEIFDPYLQLDKAANRPQEGLGLGLAIVEEVTQLMGGTISVDSTVGVGSTFDAFVPFALDTTNSLEQKAAQALKSVPVQTGPNRERARVLLIEDDKHIRELETGWLRDGGYTFESAESGAEGVAKWGLGSFDVVLVDLHMPGMDGFDTTSLLRQKEGKDKRTRIIAITADKSDKSRLRGVECGIDQFLYKPFTPEELFQTIDADAPRPRFEFSKRREFPKDILDYSAAIAVHRGDREALVRYVREVVESGTSELKNLRKHIAVGDCERLFEKAHRIKGRTAFLGTGTLAFQWSARLSEMAQQNDLDGADQVVSYLEVALQRLQLALPNL